MMAHFAKIGENNIVDEVIVVHNNVLLDDNDVEQESLGASFCFDLLGGNWVQTSYNRNIRKHFAGKGFTFDEERDAFIPPQPYPSWTLNEDTCLWDSPVPYPEEGVHEWDEDNQEWVELSWTE
jgi:hypothetical protein